MLVDEVPAEVAAVVRAVRAVRAQEGGLLLALHLEVLAQVALPAVHLAALVARELSWAGTARPLAQRRTAQRRQRRHAHGSIRDEYGAAEPRWTDKQNRLAGDIERAGEGEGG